MIYPAKKMDILSLRVASQIVPQSAKAFNQYDIGVTGSWRTIEYSETLGIFVALGINITNPLYSRNAINWTSANSIGLNFIADCVFANDQFVCVSSAGDIITSTTGTSWTVTDNTVLSGCHQAILYIPSQQRFVVAGSTGGLGYLDANLNPTAVNAPNSLSTATFKGIATDGTNIIVGVQNAAAGAKIIKSTDYGESWTVFNHIQSEIYGVAYSELLGLWVTVGRNGTAYSSDGENWVAGTIDSSRWYDVYWEPNTEIFIACSEGSLGTSLIAYSKDGKTFVTASSTDTDARQISYAADKGIFAVLGQESLAQLRVSAKTNAGVPYNG